MVFRTVRSESGFGLIQAVAALFIASIAIAGLFIASYIARHQAIGNYHYKVALLMGLQKLEEVKYKTHYYGSTTPLYSNVETGEFIMDDIEGTTIKGLIHPITKYTETEIVISPYVKYDKITVKITWRDGPRYFVYSELNREKQIILREDYFYRAELVSP